MLRSPMESDVPLMREWRNQPANRAVSLQQHEISREEHLAWWERTRREPTREVLVFEIDGTPCGVVSYFDVHREVNPTSASWGFYLDHDGLTRLGATFVAWNRVMKEAVDHAFDDLGLDVLTAEVLEHNRAVRIANRRFGFVEAPPEPRDVDGQQLSVIRVSLRREDRHRPKETT